MRILWFTNTPSLYEQGKHNYHGGGWIDSLEELIRNQKGIKLGISFFHKEDEIKAEKNGTTYFPILRKSGKNNPLKTIINNWGGKIKSENFNDKFLKIISEFKPDIIHVFGTEGPFAKVQEHSNIPVIIHIQGIINPYLNAYYPVNYSKWNFLFDKNYFFNNLIGNSPAFLRFQFEIQAKFEQNFLSKAKFIMGRTHWDKMIAELYNPNVQYFHIDEVLRAEFYENSFFLKKQDNSVFKIISTISPTIYKGMDIVLKTAELLIGFSDFKFVWEIIGLDENSILLKNFEKSEKINHKKVNIICCGKKNPEEIVELMKRSDLFVHPSYIDNSPNSVCEAQILGLPVIACNVGGVSTLVQHESTGFLVPSNGVFEIVHYVLKLYNDRGLVRYIGNNARESAIWRNSREKIMSDLLSVYSKVKS